MDKLEKLFAAKLLEVKAVKLQPGQPFTWPSGWTGRTEPLFHEKLRGRT